MSLWMCYKGTIKDKCTDFSHSGALSSLVGTDRPQLCGHMELHVHIDTVSDSQDQNGPFHKLYTAKANIGFPLTIHLRSQWR